MAAAMGFLPTLACADTDLVVLVPVFVEPHPQSDLLPNARGCAVQIDKGDGRTQVIVTVGEGETETLSCVSFVAAGRLPELGDAIGLIYTFESGPRSVFDGAVILGRDAESGDWFVDDDVPGGLTVNGDYPTLESLRQALADG